MFTLPDTNGYQVRRSSYRGNRHLAIVFLPDDQDEASRAYLRALGDLHPAIRAAGGEVLAILRVPAGQLAQLRADLALPFPLLTDADGRASAQFLPREASAGVFLIDRYGELYFDSVVDTPYALPSTAEIQIWVEAIDNQCVV